MAVVHRLYSTVLRGEPGEENPFRIVFDANSKITAPDGVEYGYFIRDASHSGTIETDVLTVIVELVESGGSYDSYIKLVDNDVVKPETKWYGPFTLFTPAPSSYGSWLNLDDMPLVREWTEAYSNAIQNVLQIGLDDDPTAIFSNEAITEIGGIFSTDCIGDTLPWDEMTATVHYGNPNAPNYDSQGPDLKTLPYGTAVKWTHDQTRVVRLYLTGVERTGKYLYRITAISGVGLLANVMHSGGLYRQATFAQVAAEIIGTLFRYEVAQELADQEIIGWLPYDTARANLHRLLFEIGAAIRKSDDGLIRFGFLSEAQPTEVPDSRVVFGGSVDYLAPATAAEVTEHTFFQGDYDETVTLFDNTAQGSESADHSLVVFNQDGPIYNLTAAQGLTINANGVNYAVVTGVGVLTGKKYSHAMRVVSKSDTSARGLRNVKRVTDNCLVSILNSQNVAKRVLAYYSSAKTVRTRLLLKNERTGDCIQVSDPYNESAKGYLQEASLTASTALFGDCEIIAGYTPTGQGNNITTVELLSESQSWVVPEGVYEITLVLIGGGEAGKNGQNGGVNPGGLSITNHDSEVAVSSAATKGGPGGKGGLPGRGGRIYRRTISVTPGQSFAFSPGSAGTASAQPGESTFGSYSSASGEYSEFGFVDVISGSIYGKQGTPGEDGKSGGDGAEASTSADNPGQKGGNSDTAVGGSGSAGQHYEHNTAGWGAGGLGGGGAAYLRGANAALSVTRTWDDRTLSGTITIRGNAARGGDGKDAVSKLNSIRYGEGGDGGGGGGGAGGLGAFVNKPWSWSGNWWRLNVYLTYQVYNNHGKGGDGAPGCALIYRSS